MKAPTPTNEPPLIHPRWWAKPRAVVAVVFVGIFTLVCLGSDPAQRDSEAHFATDVMLLAMWGLALWAILGLRERTMFSAEGVVDVGVMRTVSLPWNQVKNCVVAEKTLRAAKGPSTHGVLVRFESQDVEARRRVGKLRLTGGVIELFVPDTAPLAPDIIELLRGIPQVAQAPWNLLEPGLRQRAFAADQKRP
jgi:hypothetical protein